MQGQTALMLLCANWHSKESEELATATELLLQGADINVADTQVTDVHPCVRYENITLTAELHSAYHTCSVKVSCAVCGLA